MRTWQGCYWRGALMSTGSPRTVWRHYISLPRRTLWMLLLYSSRTELRLTPKQRWIVTQLHFVQYAYIHDVLKKMWLRLRQFFWHLLLRLSMPTVLVTDVPKFFYKRTVLQCLKKTWPLRLIWYNFTNSQRSLIICGTERPYSILNLLS